MYTELMLKYSGLRERNTRFMVTFELNISAISHAVRIDVMRSSISQKDSFWGRKPTVFLIPNSKTVPAEKCRPDERRSSTTTYLSLLVEVCTYLKRTIRPVKTVEGWCVSRPRTRDAHLAGDDLLSKPPHTGFLSALIPINPWTSIGGFSSIVFKCQQCGIQYPLSSLQLFPRRGHQEPVTSPKAGRANGDLVKRPFQKLSQPHLEVRRKHADLITV